jgi:hypothetical protein
MAEDRVQKLADILQGTCMSLEEGCGRLDPPIEQEDLSIDEHARLRELVFCCAACDWWCEVSEQNENPDGGEDLCDDCSEGDEEDE